MPPPQIRALWIGTTPLLKILPPSPFPTLCIPLPADDCAYKAVACHYMRLAVPKLARSTSLSETDFGPLEPNKI